MNPKKKIYLLIAIILIVIISISFFILIPTIKDIKNLNKGIDEQKLEIEKRYIQTHGSKRITNLNKIKTDVSKLSSIFVKKDFELEFITTLERLAAENNLEQQIKLQPNNQKIAGLIKSIPIQISLKGDFLDVLKYLQGLEKLEYYINIDSIDLTTLFFKKEAAGPNQAGVGQISVSISGETYWEI